MNFNFKFYTLFGNLKNGDTFYYEPSGVIWMKLREDEKNTYHNKAVSLDDGTVCTFDNEECVIKLDIHSEVVFSN